jgi:Uma2 family endonuclease
VEGEYVVELFQGQDVLKSCLFPELSLTTAQIFELGQ